MYAQDIQGNLQDDRYQQNTECKTCKYKLCCHFSQHLVETNTVSTITVLQYSFGGFDLTLLTATAPRTTFFKMV